MLLSEEPGYLSLCSHYTAGWTTEDIWVDSRQV